MISIEVKEQILLLNEKKMHRKCIDRLKRANPATIFCCVAIWFAIVLIIVMLALNYEEFSK